MRVINLNKDEILSRLKKAVRPDLKPGEYVDSWDYKVTKRGELVGIALIVKTVDEGGEHAQH